MVETKIVQPITASDLVAITRLHDDAEAADGHPSLGEAAWRDLDRPREPGSAGVVATVDGRDSPVGFAHIYRSDSFSPLHWALGLVVDPDARDGRAATALLERSVEHVSAHGGGLVVLWVFTPDEILDHAVETAGFRRQRELYQQRVPLPIAESPRWPAGVEVRTFVHGQDDAAWLEVNNRAFANHPEQGGWVQETLQRRLSEPWFDPKGFLLAFDADGLAGYCWTKIHPPTGTEPELGEIFVIGVDPGRHRSGLGRALVLGGLASLAERGVRTGMLFVDGENEAALRLYASLGFRTHRVDRAYARDVPST